MDRRDFVRIAGATIALPLSGCYSDREDGGKMADIEPEWKELPAPHSEGNHKITPIYYAMIEELGVVVFVHYYVAGAGAGTSVSVVPISELGRLATGDRGGYE